MADTPAAVETPPFTDNPDGDPRSVGVEIEFANLQAADGARIVSALYGGTVRAEGAHRIKVEDTEFGTFTVELDWQGAHKKAADEGDDPPSAAEKFGGEIEGDAREMLGNAVRWIVPTEIVCPPIPWNRLDALNPLFERLRAAGAEGTERSVLFGFGLHLNPEVAEASADYARRHLQAYAILEDWLRDEIGIDVTRRMLPHIDPFPVPYLRRLMDGDYRPGLERFIRDYASFNPTRNRGLDMMPLFRHLDEETLLDALQDAELIKARPTFHYRLPNVDLSRLGWNAVVEWNRWVEVERLAADEDALDSRREAFADWLEKPVHERWLDTVRGWFE